MLHRSCDDGTSYDGTENVSSMYYTEAVMVVQAMMVLKMFLLHITQRL